MKRYKKFFESDGQCDCSKCSKKEECDKKKQSEMTESSMICESCMLPEECPDNSKPAGGSCARVDANGHLGAKIQGRCNVGYMWDDKQGKCIPHTDSQKKK